MSCYRGVRVRFNYACRERIALVDPAKITATLIALLTISR